MLNRKIEEIMKGPAEFWINPTLNANGTVDIAAGGLLDSTAHPLAANIGFTQDGVDFTSNPTFEELPVDQSQSGILRAITARDTHMKTKVLNIRNYANMVMLNPGMKSVTGVGFKGLSDSLSDAFTLLPVCAIAKTPNNAGFNQVMIIFAGYNVANFSAMLSKKYNSTPLDIKAEDAGRADGATFLIYESVPTT